MPSQPGWQYNPEPVDHANSGATTGRAKAPKEVSWTASEFIAHQKSASWYWLLALAAFLGAGVVYLFTRDEISAGMILIVALMLGIFARRKPRTLQYQIDTNGIHIGTKSYGFMEFKSYSIIDEGALNSISLLPLKRFSPGVSMYYDPQDEEKITALLANYLPVEVGQKDAIDRLMHKIRF